MCFIARCQEGSAGYEAKRPHAERVCASGLLAQWHAEHLAAGGRDQNYHLMKDMIDSGAPLNAARKPGGAVVPMEGRGHIEYMNQQFAERKKVNGGPFPHHQALEIRRALCAEYRALPLNEQLKYQIMAQNSKLTDIDMPEADAVSDYERSGHLVLWGNSTLHDAINPDEAEHMLLTQWLGLHDGELGGFNQYQRRFRKRLVDWMIVRDNGSVRPGAYPRRKTCWEQHPGLCKFWDAAFLKEALESAHHFHQFARQTCGCFVQVRSLSEEFEIEALHFLAFLRKKDPVIALTAECGYVENDPIHEWARIAIMPDPTNNCITLKTTFHIMQHHYEVHAPVLPTLKVRRIIHENVPNRTDLVNIVDTSDEYEMIKKARMQKKDKKEVNAIEEVFRDMNLLKPKEEPKEPKGGTR